MERSGAFGRVEHEATVKHLDFEDISLTRQLSEVLPANTNTFAEMDELQEELQALSRNLAELDATKLLENIELQVQSEIENIDEGLNDLETHIRSSELEYIELATKERFLQYLVDAKVEDFRNTKLSYQEGSALGQLQSEVRGTEFLNTETLTACEALIKMIEEDANGMEAFRRSAQDHLDACDTKMKKALTQPCHRDDCYDKARQEEVDEVLDLKRSIDENLWEKEKISRKINSKTAKLEELQRLIKTQNRYLQEQLTLEPLKNVSVVSIEKGYITLLLQINVTRGNDVLFDKHTNQMQHELHIQFNPATSVLENAQLDRGSVPIQDIVSAVKSSHSTSGLYIGKERRLFEQLNFLVREVQHRIYIQRGEL
ncbi:hypothetical protein O6H91_11G105300 [Diphasiastrum complanatum]|nr:hypothetical protein O6H91_11G105300 [Diphasiastrum complanatum]